MGFSVDRISGPARLGRLETAHGVVETPCFMPVGTYGSVKGMDPDRLVSLGAQMVLANAYHLYFSPGAGVVKKVSGLHRFMGWKGPILTDSGGYQVFSLRELLRVDDEGVACRSPLDGSRHFMTPERVTAFQTDIGVDVAMMLDQCPPSQSSRQEIEQACRRTTAWGARAVNLPRNPEATALFGIVQGGVHPDLRKAHLEEMAAMDFEGLALGGFSVGEPAEVMHELVDALAPLMPEQKPRYLMGVGRPVDLVRSAAAGIDLFDCVMPTRHARNGQLFTTSGRINIANARFREDPDPVDAGCRCPTCRRFSRAYLSHLYRRKEIFYNELATTHNLSHYLELMRRIRAAIGEGTLGVLLSEVEKAG